MLLKEVAHATGSGLLQEGCYNKCHTKIYFLLLLSPALSRLSLDLKCQVHRIQLTDKSF